MSNEFKRRPEEYTIEIIRSSAWMLQRYHARIRHRNGRIVWSTEKQFNLKDLETTCNRFASATGISSIFKYVGFKNR